MDRATATQKKGIMLIDIHPYSVKYRILFGHIHDYEPTCALENSPEFTEHERYFRLVQQIKHVAVQYEVKYAIAKGNSTGICSTQINL